MTEDDIVLKYLTNNYDFKLESGLCFIDKNTSSILSQYELKEEIFSIFCGMPNALEVFKNWCQRKLDDLVGEFKKILDDAYVVLGPCNWEVKHPIYGTMDTNHLGAYYFGQKNLPKWLMTRYFDMWYEDRIIEETEKAIKNIW